MESGPVPSDLPSLETLQAQLLALRECGMPQRDPLQWCYLHALCRRSQAAAPALQALLLARLAQAISQAQSRLTTSSPDVARLVARPTQVGITRSPALAAPVSPLAELNHYLRAQQSGQAPLAAAAAAGDVPDMKSVQRFRELWSHIAAEQQVSRALDHAPENAGPLNSQRLVSRSLELMRELAPDYLRRFVAYADTLLWLEQAQQQLATPEGKTATRRVRARR